MLFQAHKQKQLPRSGGKCAQKPAKLVRIPIKQGGVVRIVAVKAKF
jgi:hypothetical protein